MITPANNHVSAALKKCFRGIKIAPAPASLKMTYHRVGGQIIVSPKHGMIGWNDNTEYIYDERYGPVRGWYLLKSYQASKAIHLGQFDHRIITPNFYMMVHTTPSPEVVTSRHPRLRRDEHDII